MPLRPDFSPAPCPDESLHSLVSRYHRLTGYTDCRTTLHELFGTHTHVVTSVLPTGLGAVQKALLPDWSGREVVDGLTLFPYFHPFLDRYQADRAYDYLLGQGQGAVKTLLGLVASQIGASNFFRFCPACLVDDRQTYGQAYWHRSHQLPGVWLCPIHDMPLFDLPAAWVASQRHQLFLPDDRSVSEQAVPLFVTSSQLAVLRRLAGLCVGVLQTNPGSAGVGGGRECYRQQAERLDLTHSSGRLRLPEVLSRLHSSVSALPSTREFAFFHRASIDEGCWGLVLLHKPRRALHPLKHLVLADSLGLDCSTLLEGLSGKASSGTVPPPPLASPSSSVERDALLVSLLGERQLSLRRCAALTGISVTTLRLEAARLGLAVSVRPKTLHPERLLALARDLASGMPLTEATTAHRVSLATVYRTLRLWPDIAAQRKALLQGRERDARREHFLNDLSSMWLRQSAEYVWLYRNDRAWLVDQVERRGARPKHGKQRVDWYKRDRELAAKVTQWFRMQSGEAGPPFWVTRGRIGRELHVSAWLEHASDRLPLTRLVLSKLVETRAQYQCRKLCWAREQLWMTGLPIVPWRLLRLAGIRVPADSSVQRYVRRLCEEATETVVAEKRAIPRRIG